MLLVIDDTDMDTFVIIFEELKVLAGAEYEITYARCVKCVGALVTAIELRGLGTGGKNRPVLRNRQVYVIVGNIREEAFAAVVTPSGVNTAFIVDSFS